MECRMQCCAGMPDRDDKAAKQKAERALRRGKRPTTAAGEFVREEIRHVRKGQHGARSTEQAIAIGLSKARRAGVPLRPSHKRARAIHRALGREPHKAGSRIALSEHTHKAARTRRRHAR
jgi:hypothetical protein